MSSHYVVRPKADQDLDDQAYYLATKASAELGSRFLAAAHETFALPASRPGIGWRSRFQHLLLKSLRVFRVTGFPRMLVLYRPIQGGVEILRVIHGSRDVLALLRREGLEG